MFGITFSLTTLAIGALPYVLATALATWLFLDGKDNPYRSDRKAQVIGEQVVITIMGVGLMFLALMVGGALSKGGLLGLFSLPVMVGVIAGGYALVGMMMYEMEFGTGFGYGFTILTLHVLTTWGIIKFL